jgi:hypothetical protein
VNPYEVLGVPVGAPVEEIRRAYLVLARRHHPDFHVGESPALVAEAGRRMQTVNEAWAALSDPATRRRYEGDIAQSFRPFHPHRDDDPDPRYAPDVPYRPAGPVSALERAWVLVPVGLFAAAGLTAGLGVATGSTGLLTLALIFFLLSCIGFLVLPLLALGRAARDEG